MKAHRHPAVLVDPGDAIRHQSGHLRLPEAMNKTESEISPMLAPTIIQMIATSKLLTRVGTR